MRGEALFLRALDYYYLVLNWGGVPLVLTPQTEEEARENTRAAAEEVYAQIESDLQESIELLPPAPETEAGRASKGAARTLLAKVLLQQGKKSEAEPYLRAIVSSGNYTLDNNGDGQLTPEDFAMLWDNSVNFAPESIFEIVYSPNPAAVANSSNANFYMVKLTGQGPKIMITPETRAAFEAGDARRDLSMFQIEAQDSENYFSKKYRYEDAFCANQVCSKNWMVFRYADVLLMLTEVSGDPQYANMVRERAGLEPKSSYTLDQIVHERRVELLLEDDRFLTLKRTGKALDVLNAKADILNIRGGKVEEYELLWPIPQGALDNNPKLEQNPGYPQ
jgi:hypothetical protein